MPGLTELLLGEAPWGHSFPAVTDGYRRQAAKADPGQAGNRTFLTGWHGRTRTCTTPLNRRVLYRLSFVPVVDRVGVEPATRRTSPGRSTT